MKEQKKQFFKLKSKDKESLTLSLSSLLLAIDYFFKIETQGFSKNKTQNIENIKGKSTLIILSKKKLRLKAKREKLLNLWSIIVDLKTANYSYREIANYLKSRHRLEVSHTFIRNLWMEIENDNN